jgi:hypothetical protein
MQSEAMGKPPPRPDTLDPVLLDQIDRYVRAALEETGTARPPSPPRLARASVPPPSLGGPAPAPHVERPVLVTEFSEERPTDVSGSPLHLGSDDEETGVYTRPPSG